MERRGRARGGRPWQNPSSSSSSSFRSSSHDRWKPSLSSGPSSSWRKDGVHDTNQIHYDNHKKDSSLSPDNHGDISLIIGTCPDMCPARERYQREKFRDLAVFERLHGNPQRTASTLAVKKFCRTMSAASEQPSSIRPLPVLQETLRYLLDIVDTSDQSFEVIHDFVLDRTRAIRQDLSIQNIVHDNVIIMYEEMVKFHIISEKRLRNECSKVDLSSLLHMNMEQMMKSLTSLYNLYGCHRRSGGKNFSEPEFCSFYLILQLTRKSEDGNTLSLWLRKVSPSILQSTEVRFARSILRHFRMGNYRRFLSLATSESTYLQLCLLEPVLNKVRAQALICINHSSYQLQPYPLSELSYILMTTEEELDALCHSCGLKTSRDTTGNLILPTKQAVNSSSS